ncbi:MAG: aromatic ring-hydroxylating dioxygenase subunit alpha [Bacteroidota bacterium]
MNKKFYINPDIHQAETLPADFYRDPEVFDALKERIFLKSWHWVGHENLLPLSGSVYPFTLLSNYLEEPLILVRDPQNQLHCLSNVCTHRGNILVHAPCQVNKLLCRYHGRKFDLKGHFHFMPEFRGAKDFPRPCDDLPSFPIVQWGSFLFASLAPSFEIKSVFEKMDEYVGFLPLAEFTPQPYLNKDYLVNCHWALYCDNYLEGFHIPFVHSDLNAVLDYGAYRTEIYDYMNVQIGYAEGGEEVFDLPKGHRDYGRHVAAYYFWIFPNIMFNFYPWGLSINLVQPINQQKTRVSFISYVYDESKRHSGAGALLDKVEREDEFVVEGVHKGLHSRFYQTGRFSPTRERGVHHFHQLLASFVNERA